MSNLLTIIVFFTFYSDSNLIYLIFVSLVLIIFAPKGTSKKVVITSIIISCIFYPLIFGLLFIIG
ncbi:hypothetical protein COK54_12945 [Bacillus cereus]|nr:hypothetical protein CN531_31610 [Bacillus cereus]PFS94588.1 hypothetical protein COK54_12945 [Bacillus cereus]